MSAKKSKKTPLLPGATHAAKVYGPACGDHLELFLRVESGIVREARFRSQACRATTRLATMAAEKISGLGEAEIFSWSEQRLRDWDAHGDRTQAHAVQAVLEALHLALQSPLPKAPVKR